MTAKEFLEEAGWEGKLVEREAWVLTAPDNEHYTEEDAKENISSLAERFEVKATATGETWDCGHGQEEKFLLQGEEENIALFLKTLNEELV